MSNKCFFCESDTEPLRRFWYYPSPIWDGDCGPVRVEQICEECDYEQDFCHGDGRPRSWSVVYDCWFCHGPLHGGGEHSSDEDCPHCGVFSDSEAAVVAGLYDLAVALFGRETVDAGW